MGYRTVVEIDNESLGEMRPHARHVYREHADQIPDLIRQLAGPTKEERARALDLLSKMGRLVVPQLLAALQDSTLDPHAVDEVVALLGAFGDDRAKEPLWQFLQSSFDNPRRLSNAAVSLAGLGDNRALPFLRCGLDAENTDLVADALLGMMTVGQLEDIEHLCQVHRRHISNLEIRYAVAHAILMILGETDEVTIGFILETIRLSSMDRPLWIDIWTIMQGEVGHASQIVH